MKDLTEILILIKYLTLFHYYFPTFDLKYLPEIIYYLIIILNKIISYLNKFYYPYNFPNEYSIYLSV